MIEIEGNRVRLDSGREFSLQYPVQDARLAADILLILYKPESHKGGQFRNLVALDLSGNELWKAELPTTMSMDSYYKLVSENPIVADSLCSYRCTIDSKTGQIARREFFK